MNNSPLVATVAPIVESEQDRKDREWKARLGRQLIRRELAKTLAIQVPEELALAVGLKQEAVRLAIYDLQDAVREAISAVELPRKRGMS